MDLAGLAVPAAPRTPLRPPAGASAERQIPEKQRTPGYHIFLKAFLTCLLFTKVQCAPGRSDTMVRGNSLTLH